MGGGGFEAYGEAIAVSEDRVVVPFAVVGPTYSVVRRDRGHRFELAVIASFNCPDGSLFIQEIAGAEQRQMNDPIPDDGLTLTLLARNGNRYRFPPFVCSFAKTFFTLSPSTEVQYKVTVLNRTSDSVGETWLKHVRSLNAEAQRQFEAQHRQQRARHQYVAHHHLVNSMQNLNLAP